MPRHYADEGYELVQSSADEPIGHWVRHTDAFCRPGENEGEWLAPKPGEWKWIHWHSTPRIRRFWDINGRFPDENDQE